MARSSRLSSGGFKARKTDLRIGSGRLFIPAAACYPPSPTPHRGRFAPAALRAARREALLSPGGRGELAMARKPNGQPNGGPELALTFDDVLLKPGLSELLPSEVGLRTRTTRDIALEV